MPRSTPTTRPSPSSTPTTSASPSRSRSTSPSRSRRHARFYSSWHAAGTKIPLPKSFAPPGSIPLPPEQDTLLSENYQLLPALKPPTQIEEAEDDNEAANASPANPSPSYPQDQRGSEQHQPQNQRVSFQLNAVAAAAAKRPLVTIDQLNVGQLIVDRWLVPASLPADACVAAGIALLFHHEKC